MNIAVIATLRSEWNPASPVPGTDLEAHWPDLLVSPREIPFAAPGTPETDEASGRIVRVPELSPRVGGGFLLRGPSESLELPGEGLLPWTLSTGSATGRGGDAILSAPPRDRLFIARLSGGGVLNRLEEERPNIGAAVLWNDLPFGLTQVAVEIDALSLSRRLRLPIFWLSTQWAGKSEADLHRRGFWVSNCDGEIVRSEYRHDFTDEMFELGALEESAARLPGTQASGLKILRTNAPAS